MVRFETGWYLTVEEVSKRFGCSMQTVRNRIRDKKVKAIPVRLAKNKMVFLIPENAVL